MVSKLEKETIITFNEEEKLANIYSCSPAIITKIKKVKGSYEIGGGMAVDVPKNCVKIDWKAI